MLYVLIGLAALLSVLALIGWLGSSALIARRKPDPPASPADHGLAFENIALTTSDGLTLRGWYIPAPDPSASLRAGSSRTIVVCPGHNGSMDADVVVAPWLHAAGFNVLMFDWRGHGRSEGARVSLGVLERLDLLAAVAFAQSKGAARTLALAGSARVGVLGFSMGGAVALSTAAGCPAIQAVCSDGGFARVTMAVENGLRERGLPDPLPAFLASIFVLVAGLRLGIDLRQADPIRWVDRIAPRPVLFVHGQRDPFVPIAEAEAMLARARRAQQGAGLGSELWRVPDAGHRDIHLLHTEDYRRRIIDFFNRAL